MPDELSIAWLTPLSVRSAIGDFSAHVTRALAAHATVELWAADPEPWHEAELPVVSFADDPARLAELEHRDVVVYNVGDHLPFHRRIVEAAASRAGVVILHDRVMHHLYAQLWLHERPAQPRRYVDRMRAHYGSRGERLANESLSGQRQPVWELDEEVIDVPLYEEAIQNATGVVVHSESQARDVGRRWLGPLRSLQMPCYATVLERAAASAVASATDGKVELLTLGHINPNKHALRIVELLLDRPELAKQVRYTIAGPYDGFRDYVEALRTLLSRHPGELEVEITGWLTDDEVHRRLQRADVFLNLRHPVMEGGSASVMQQLAYGKPVVCFDAGHFGELPAAAVMRAPAGDFPAAIDAIKQLVADPELRRRTGAAGRDHAACATEAAYAEGLLELIDESRRASVLLGALDNVARTLGEMNVDPRLSIYDRIATDFGRVLDP